MVVQYLDDILVVGKKKQQVHRVTHNVTDALREASFLVGAKSILTPMAEVTWMGKTVNAQAGRIQPRRVAVADCVTRWIRLAVAPVTRVSLRRLLGRLVWLDAPVTRRPHSGVGHGPGYTLGHAGRPGHHRTLSGAFWRVCDARCEGGCLPAPSICSHAHPTCLWMPRKGQEGTG